MSHGWKVLVEIFESFGTLTQFPRTGCPRLTRWLETSARGQRLSLREKENRVGLTQQPVPLHRFTDDLMLSELPRGEQLFQSLKEAQRGWNCLEHL